MNSANRHNRSSDSQTAITSENRLEENPYSMPTELATQERVTSEISFVLAGLLAWLGTSLAGAVFGLIGAIIGFVFGLIYAAVVAAPVCAVGFTIVAIVRKGKGRRGDAILTAAICGGATGVICTTLLFGGQRIFDPGAIMFPVIAGILGAAVPALLVAIIPVTKQDSAIQPQQLADWADLE